MKKNKPASRMTKNANKDKIAITPKHSHTSISSILSFPLHANIRRNIIPQINRNSTIFGNSRKKKASVCAKAYLIPSRSLSDSSKSAIAPAQTLVSNMK